MQNQLTIYYTSDTHGAILPADGGSSLLGCTRAFADDGNTLVLDGGDTIQGSPLTTYLWQQGEFESVVPAAFDEVGYHYYTLGNHDFNNGYAGLTTFVRAMSAKCVVANVTDGSGQLPLLPWVVHTTASGLRVGLTGIVTDYVNLWESPENLENLQVTDPFDAAKAALEALRYNKCDIVICLYHGGYEEALETGVALLDGSENVGCRICRELDFDLLLTAHQHSETSGRLLHGTYTLQPPANAAKFAHVVATQTPAGWQFASELVATPPVTEADSPLMRKLSPLQERYTAWLAATVGSLATAVPPSSKLDCALHGTAVADLCNMVQLGVTGADISCTGLGNQPVSLPQQLTMGDICRAFPFANTITVLQVTSEVLLQALERCASYLDLQAGQPVLSDHFLRPKVEHYNYDYFAGVHYCVDLTNPVGQRVHGVRVNGKPLLDGGSYRLALSNYRATGTGGYSCYATCPVVRTYSDDVRQVIVDHLATNPELNIPSLGGVVWGAD